MKSSLSRILITCLVFSTASTSCLAEELSTLLGNIEKYAGEQNYAKALEELQWAKNELEKLHMKELSTLLPEELIDFKGGAPETNTAMGMKQIGRKYSSGSNSFEVEIMSGSGAGGQGFGGLAALGQMAALMGQQPGQETFRIDGRTARLDTSSKELTIFLEGGAMLKIQHESGEVDLKAASKALDLETIEKRLSGK